jgi:hypothetical protein
MSEDNGNAARFLKAEYRKDGVWTLIPGNRLPDNKNNRKKLKDLLDEFTKDSSLQVRIVLYEVTETPLEIIFGEGAGLIFKPIAPANGAFKE